MNMEKVIESTDTENKIKRTDEEVAQEETEEEYIEWYHTHDQAS